MTLNDELYGKRISDNKLEKFTMKNLRFDEIFPCPYNPYQVTDDEKMEELIESAKENGILNPIMVRKLEENKYEIVSGHRRFYAANKLGIYVLPCLVGDITKEEADIIMVDSNLQRENIKISEKAKAYKIKLEAMKRQGVRSDLTSGQNDLKFQSRDILAEELGLSSSKIKRLVKLAELKDEFLDMLDEKEITLESGYNLAFLSKETQQSILNLIYAEPKIVPTNFTPEIRAEILKLKDNGDISNIRSLFISMIESKQKPAKAKPEVKYRVDTKSLNEKAATSLAGYKKKEIEELIVDLLNNHFGE
ncbi:MAG: ParB/RepB/Spo0J family partition protein [Peptostreptococcaceae bacterium]|nr:ParB/RepB/Spo0J family partition protein [Peptostreptococcaceae bacterium]